MAAEGGSSISVRGREEGRGEESAELREPILITPDELGRAIRFGENIWRRPDAPVDTSVQWGDSNFPSRATSAMLEKCRTVFRIPDTIKLILPRPDERAYYPRPGCVAVSENLFRAGLRLPFHPFFRLVFRSYGLAPTQLNPNSWSQLVGSWMLWRQVNLGVDMPFSVFHSVYFSKSVAGEGSKGWYYLSPWGSHSPFIWRPALFNQGVEKIMVLGSREVGYNGERPHGASDNSHHLLHFQ